LTIASYLGYQLPAGDKRLIPQLLELCNKPATRNWALEGLKAVDPAIADERVLAWLQAALHQQGRSAADQQLLIGYLSYQKGPYGNRDSKISLRFVPEIETLLFDPDENTRRHTRLAVSRIEPADARGLVKRLNARLDDERDKDRTEVIRALAAIGPQALPAEGKLETIALSASDPNRYAAGVALERIRDNGDNAYQNLGIDVGTTNFAPFNLRLDAERRELLPDGDYPPHDPMLGGGGGGGIF
jgi:HEAT repeat protein